jgi:inorganic pyrophosphatase
MNGKNGRRQEIDRAQADEARNGSDPFQRLLGLMFKAHPWHGVSIGQEAPDVVMAYIEIVPTDTVKYEVDKRSGFLKVDRPQRFSNCCPVYYGLIPQTYSGEQVAGIFAKRARRKGMVGDGDPLDICVLSEKSIPHSDILLTGPPDRWVEHGRRRGSRRQDYRRHAGRCGVRRLHGHFAMPLGTHGSPATLLSDLQKRAWDDPAQS